MNPGDDDLIRSIEEAIESGEAALMPQLPLDEIVELCELSILNGKKILAIEGMKEGSEEIVIRVEGGVLTMYHPQACCESVTVTEVTGEPSDLVGQVILNAFEASSEVTCCADYEYKYTFYYFLTHKDEVMIRWNGESNGYYGIEVETVWKEDPNESEA